MRRGSEEQVGAGGARVGRASPREHRPGLSRGLAQPWAPQLPFRGSPPTARKAPPPPGTAPSRGASGGKRQAHLAGVRTRRPLPASRGSMGQLWGLRYSGNTTLTFLWQLLAKTPPAPYTHAGSRSARSPEAVWGLRETEAGVGGVVSVQARGSAPRAAQLALLQLRSRCPASPLPSCRKP